MIPEVYSNRFFINLQEQTKNKMFFANCYALYAKRQLIIPATIIATYSRDNIY